MKLALVKELIGLFSEKTSCAVQHRGCPCNSCFHAIKDVDFQHICWLILLLLRGDYKGMEADLIKDIKEELRL